MTISEAFPSEARHLLVVRGRDLLETMGLPALREVVASVLCGGNVRAATELLTKRRINLLAAAMLATYSALAAKGLGVRDISESARREYLDPGSSAEDKIILRWMLGLTNKQVQNVLRSDELVWEEYVEQHISTLEESAEWASEALGAAPMQDGAAEINWDLLIALLSSVGAQTLGIRGAEKSLYGKFFEKLILGAVLSVLGFEFAGVGCANAGSFWLSSRGARRESDATAVWTSREAARFDIGFIGSGNPEITLDKLTRFEREAEIGGVAHTMRTVVIVDTIGPRSAIAETARRVGAAVVQMSKRRWVEDLGDSLERAFDGFTSPVAALAADEYEAALQAGVQAAPLEEIFEVAVAADEEAGSAGAATE